jgi:hypothetical protein
MTTTGASIERTIFHRLKFVVFFILFLYKKISTYTYFLINKILIYEIKYSKYFIINARFYQ